MISMNDPKFEIPSIIENDKTSSKSIWGRRVQESNYSQGKRNMDTSDSYRHIQIYVKLDSQVETEERLEAIIVSNLLVETVIQIMINNLKYQPTYTGC